MIGIIDYGMGNLHSVSSALKRLEYPYVVSENPEELARAKGLLLPGVGAFKDAMHSLTESGLKAFILEEAEKGKPLLGICLGMQLLFEESEENGLTAGLSLLPGKVERFKGKTEAGKTYKVPHMGWNKLTFHQESPLLENVEEGYVYFVHSYVVKTNERAILLATADYDVQVPAVVGRGTIFGTQFHPEKSSTVGMSILRNFCEMVEEKTS
ncbi:imidazole glycerol phosphate synthase subunit HisH [Fictibacillus sp. Mic-4]|uniref:imidazole glycerol phosphate synthase subunit HisH n=1 Tax=Fictibacillus sp. Mic-4 TaxID=3132826 RepID=UPI003CF43D81